MSDKINVRINSMNMFIGEFGGLRHIDMGITLYLPENFRLTSSPHEIEAFLQHCFNAGMTTYPQEQKKLTG